MPPPFVACSRCSTWLSGEPHVRVEARAYCPGPCAPWARVPSPLPELEGLAARALERLRAKGLPTARAESVATWLEREGPRWPGERPWVTWAHAARARCRLESLLAWRPYRGPAPRWSGGMAWPEPPGDTSAVQPPGEARKVAIESAATVVIEA